MSILRRSMLAGVALTAAVGANAMTPSPAQAGGPGTVYVYGSTYAQCTSNLSAAVKLMRANGYTVTGVQSCRKTGDGSRYFGEYVVS